MKFNVWKSEYTGNLYPVNTEAMPQCNGWEIIATIEAKNLLEAENLLLMNKLPKERVIK